MQNINLNKFHIIQWNPNGFYSKIDEIKLLVNKFSPIALCIQETNFNNHKSIHLNNYSSYIKNRNHAGRASGGVAIFINNIFPSEEITISSHLEVIAVNMTAKSNLTICNIYLPNSQDFNASDIQNIIDQLPTPFIILGVFNSHNTLWGCNVTDHRGTKIETLLNTNNINILNNGQATRVNSSNGNLSAIDLTFSSATISPNLELDIIPELSSSDYFPIKITLCYTNPYEIHTRNPKWKLSNADWNIFQTEIEKNLRNSSFPNENTIDENIEQFSKLIYNTASNTFEQFSYSGKRPQVPWRNKNIKHAIRNKKTSYNTYKRTKQIQDFIDLKKKQSTNKIFIQK